MAGLVHAPRLPDKQSCCNTHGLLAHATSAPEITEVTINEETLSCTLQVQRELEEERLLAAQAAREAQAAIEAKQSELQAIEAARLRAVRACELSVFTRVQRYC